jgi:hypothetical protein
MAPEASCDVAPGDDHDLMSTLAVEVRRLLASILHNSIAKASNRWDQAECSFVAVMRALSCSFSCCCTGNRGLLRGEPAPHAVLPGSVRRRQVSSSCASTCSLGDSARAPSTLHGTIRGFGPAGLPGLRHASPRQLPG